MLTGPSDDQGAPGRRTSRRRRRCRALAAAAALTAVLAAPAGADVLSLLAKAQGDSPSEIRLVAGQVPGAGKEDIRAGLVLRLRPGWITYWRHPGDAGIPPRFDFSGSENAAAVTVLWPAPQRIAKGGVVSIGYDRDVVFPLRVRPADPARPVTLRLKADYGICEKLCRPAQAEAQIQLPVKASPSGFDIQLAMAERRVPRPNGGDGVTGGASPVRIEPVPRHTGRQPGRLLIDVIAPAQQGVALFAESPHPGWSPPVPELIEANGSRHRFAIDLADAADAEPRAVRLTATDGEHAVEATIPIGQ